MLIPAVIALVGSVATSILFASRGSEMVHLEREISSLEQENRELEERIASQSSLTDLAKRAQDLGLHKPYQIVYTTDGEDSLAKLP